MATMAAPRKTISIYDYPEHLNPFRDDDNHNKIRFWTIGKKLNRSNSITFSGIKDLKNSWAFRSFMRKGKKQNSSQNLDNKPSQMNGENSPVVFRRAVQYSSMCRSTVGSPERADRYIYRGSVTPLPRSRFQERLRSPSQNEVQSLSLTPRMARSEVTGSRLSVESTNPFDDEPPVPPVRMSRRKKKKAPMPPQSASAHDTSITISETSEAQTSVSINETLPNTTSEDAEVDTSNLNIELRIVEDEDLSKNKLEITETEKEAEKTTDDSENNNKEESKVQEPTENTVKSAGSEDDILKKASFPKIDIAKYRRNSSVNEDEIRLRRGNLEDFHVLSTKRSKSLNNAYDSSFVTYDLNLNEEKTVKDANGNDEPQKVICKVYDEPVRKQSIDNSISSTEKEFIEIDKATRELEREISKLNSALNDDDDIVCSSFKVSEIRRKFDNGGIVNPNPIPKPRRSHYGEKIDV